MIGQTAPTNPLDAFLAELTALRNRVGDLERLAAAGTAKGIIDLAEATASTWTNASTSVATDITATTGAAPSLTLELSTRRRYRAVFVVDAHSTANGDRVYFFFVEGATTRRVARTALPTAGQDFQAVVTYSFVPASATAVTYKIQGRAGNSSTGTVGVAVNNTNQPMQFYIEDLGPA